MPISSVIESHSLPAGDPSRMDPIPEKPKDKPLKVHFWSGWNVDRSEWDLVILSTCLKLLLYPAYRSTDFEVHRNWLAITHSLSLSKWYFDTTSEWTLDYPPFFAYFEKVMSYAAYVVDPKIVDLQNLNYDSWSVVAFQRTTVIITELVLALAVLRFVRGSVNPAAQQVISASLFLHPGFLIVDHIHFQYNGFMFGILLWSLLMARDGNLLISGTLFAILLNFKHIYIYLAPAYFVYLLRAFCMSSQGEILPMRFVSLANAVIAVFVASLGPFIVMGQLPQVLSRLFPFTRGLNHAYWAPNVWSLVTAADRVLLRYAKRSAINVPVNLSGVASSSRGLVGDTVFAVIPNVKPIHTFAITLVFQIVFLLKLWRNPTYKSFVTALTLCGYASFMFGWHVHEKAILLVLVPLSLLAGERQAFFRTFVIASVAGIYSLFPLIFMPAESVVKVVYSALWAVFVFLPLNRLVYEFPITLPYVILDFLEKTYLAGFPFLFALTTWLSSTSGKNTAMVKIPQECIPTEALTCPNPVPATTTNGASPMEFLPLMLTSVYCAVGLVWGFIRLSVIYLKQK